MLYIAGFSIYFLPIFVLGFGISFYDVVIPLCLLSFLYGCICFWGVHIPEIRSELRTLTRISSTVSIFLTIALGMAFLSESALPLLVLWLLLPSVVFTFVSLSMYVYWKRRKEKRN
jgi:O-antigen/teichoic acid export membrane protein